MMFENLEHDLKYLGGILGDARQLSRVEQQGFRFDVFQTMTKFV